MVKGKSNIGLGARSADEFDKDAKNYEGSFSATPIFPQSLLSKFCICECKALFLTQGPKYKCNYNRIAQLASLDWFAGRARAATGRAAPNRRAARRGTLQDQKLALRETIGKVPSIWR